MKKKLLKADLHIHSSFSFDSQTPVKEIIAEARAKGLDVIGITDHGTRQGGIEAAKIAKGIQVLVGQEVKTRQGDILVFNVDVDLLEGEELEKTCKKAKELGGFIIIPHPFDPLRQVTGKNTEKIVKYADAIEVFNPRCFFEWSNRKAEAFAASKGIPGLASSDAHSREDVGRAYTLVEDRGDFFEAIREGNVSLVKGRVDKAELIRKKVRKTLGRDKG